MTDEGSSPLIEAKSGLTKASLPDAFFSCLYRAISPYRGCAHGCAYCDGRAEKYYVEGVFDRDVAVRHNAAEAIARDVARGAASLEEGAIGIGSGVTDVYQPLEARLALTRASLERMADTGQAIVVLTKNALVLRDFDLLSRFRKALVMVTVTTLDPALAATLEPGASTPAERLEVVERARGAGFFAGVMAMPLCPGLSAERASTERLFAACRDSGAQFIQPGGLTLRPGRQKEHFNAVLSEHRPDLLPLYSNLFSENRVSGMPKADARQMDEMTWWHRFLDEQKIPTHIPHAIHRELLSVPDSVFVLLCHMIELFSTRNVSTARLKKSLDRYASWLTAERTSLRRKRARACATDPFPVTRELTDRLRSLAQAPEMSKKPPIVSLAKSLETVLENERLSAFLRDVIVNNAVFDYSTLSLSAPS